MKMKHFMTEEWIDFVNQVSSPKQQEAMKKHLGTGCRRCAQALATWQKVHNAAAVEERYQPPAADVRIAKAAFASAGGAKQRKEKGSLVEVLFDSFLQPMLAGARSSGLGTRQMLYRADPYQIDIQIEAKTEGNRLMVTGQFLDVNLVRVSAIEHLSSSQTARTRAGQHRLQETVEQHFDQAALCLPLLGAAGRSECCFGDSHVRRGRLIALLDCRRVVNLLPRSKDLRASPATCTQVFLHRFLLLWRTHLVHEIDPFLSHKVLHFHSPISLSPSFRSPADPSQVQLLGIKGTRGKERYREGAF